MGGARALVAVSTSCPACTCRVSNSAGSLQDETNVSATTEMRRSYETTLLVEVGRHKGGDNGEKEERNEWVSMVPHSGPFSPANVRLRYFPSSVFVADFPTRLQVVSINWGSGKPSLPRIVVRNNFNMRLPQEKKTCNTLALQNSNIISQSHLLEAKGETPGPFIL